MEPHHLPCLISFAQTKTSSRWFEICRLTNTRGLLVPLFSFFRSKLVICQRETFLSRKKHSWHKCTTFIFLYLYLCVIDMRRSDRQTQKCITRSEVISICLDMKLERGMFILCVVPTVNVCLSWGEHFFFFWVLICRHTYEYGLFWIKYVYIDVQSCVCVSTTFCY